MKNRIDLRFEECAAQGRKALITFVTAGDPDLDTTEALVLSMEENGADIIELGVPFSDPIAEGPVIQRASQRSLANHTRLEEVLALVKRLREKTQIPLCLMMYVNTLYVHGIDPFFARCQEAGVDGVILPDVPLEEHPPFDQAALAHEIHPIYLVAPTSHERIQSIAQRATGFLYCVSSLGVTGKRKEYATDFDSFFGEIRRSCQIPCAVGFGISGPEQVRQMGQYAQGVIVGSALVELVERYGKDALGPAGEFVAQLARAARGEPEK